jgi:carboxylesterase type B
MFPDTQQQQLFTKRLAEAKKMALTDSAPDMAFNTPGTKAAEDLASVAGNYKARIGVRGVVSGMQDATKSLLIGGDKLFDMLFQNKDITTKFKDTYLTRMGVKSAAISQDANNMSDEELQKAYQEYLQQQGGSTAPTMAPEPSVAPEPMTAPMEAPEASLDPSTMTDEQLQQLYMEYQQMQQQKPTDMAPTPIQGQQL